MVNAYSGIWNLGAISTNMEGSIGWATTAGGKSSGSVTIGDYLGDTNDTANQVINNDFDKVIDICLEGPSVYIIDGDSKIYHIKNSGSRITKTEIPSSMKTP